RIPHAGGPRRARSKPDHQRQRGWSLASSPPLDRRLQWRFNTRRRSRFEWSWRLRALIWRRCGRRCIGGRSGLSTRRPRLAFRGRGFVMLAAWQILLRVHRHQRFDGHLGLLEDGVGLSLGDPGWLVSSKGAEEDKDDGYKQETSGQAENEAHGAVERADAAIEHAVGDAESNQADDDQGNDKDACGEADLSKGWGGEVGFDRLPIFWGEVERGDRSHRPGENRQNLPREPAHHGEESRNEHDDDENDIEPGNWHGARLLRRAWRRLSRFPAMKHKCPQSATADAGTDASSHVKASGSVPLRQAEPGHELAELGEGHEPDLLKLPVGRASG